MDTKLINLIDLGFEAKMTMYKNRLEINRPRKRDETIRRHFDSTVYIDISEITEFHYCENKQGEIARYTIK